MQHPGETPQQCDEKKKEDKEKKLDLAPVRTTLLPGGVARHRSIRAAPERLSGVLALSTIIMVAWYVIYVPSWAAERKYASETKMGASKTEARKQARRVHDHLAFWRRNPPVDGEPSAREGCRPEPAECGMIVTPTLQASSYRGPMAASARPESWVRTSRSASLSGRASKNTEPELLLRRALHAAGARFRLHRRLAKGCTPDLVLPGRKVSVFVDGDFWHGCPTHFPDRRPSGPNASLWLAKFEAVKERDARSTRLAEEAGWRVVRVWECEVAEDLESVVDRILALPGKSNT